MIHMHHNYMTQIRFGGLDLNLTRKGAVDASEGNWVIIPGSMGAKTYIGRGLGNKESFYSCSHGAGRAMSRTQALKQFTVEDHGKATEGVYCDKTRAVLDETPAAYKPIEDVMRSQSDLVEPVLTIKQLVCVKGLSD
jgi:tRNA-splicing ligase RtcB